MITYNWFKGAILLLKLTSSHCSSVVTKPTSVCEYVGFIPGLVHWVKDAVLPWAVVVGRRRGLDPALVPWCRRVASALIQPLAWELQCVLGVALKKTMPPPPANSQSKLHWFISGEECTSKGKVSQLWETWGNNWPKRWISSGFAKYNRCLEKR